MATQRQFQANRTNAKASTGPKTESGKARSAQNAFRHGLASGHLILDGESQEEYDALLAELTAEHKPATVTEKLLVTQMAQHHWLAQRAIMLQARTIDQVFPFNEATKSLAVFIRYQTANERGFRQALEDLRKLQKQRQNSEIGFVSQGKPEPQQKAIMRTASRPQQLTVGLDSGSNSARVSDSLRTI